MVMTTNVRIVFAFQTKKTQHTSVWCLNLIRVRLIMIWIANVVLSLHTDLQMYISDIAWQQLNYVWHLYRLPLRPGIVIHINHILITYTVFLF